MASPTAHTLQDLAAICRVSKMTVSRALRGQPGVSPALAERIRAAAEKAGYQPNPAVGSVMRLLRRREATGYHENLAFIWTHAGSRPLPLLVPWRDHARARAERLGYRLDEFFLRAPGMTSARLRTILRTRGIRGILFAPDTAPPLPHVSFNVAGFAAVLLGSSLLNRGLARVQFDHFQLIHLALRQVRKAGYRRPALFLSPSIDARTQGRLRAGCLMHSAAPPAERARLIYLGDMADRPAMLKWISRHRPDVVIFIEADLPRLFARPPAARIPPLVALSKHHHSDAIPGILQSAEAIGRAAVDLVVAQIQRHEFGRIPFPQKVMLEGTWSGGEGLPRGETSDQ